MGGTMSITLNGTTGITTPDLTSAAPMDVGGSAVLTAASSLAAANLTGALPAISGAALTGLTASPVELISTVTVTTNLNNIDILLPSGYFRYTLSFDNLVPYNNTTLIYWRSSSNNGVTFDAGASDYYSNGAVTASAAQLASVGVYNNKAAGGLSGEVTLINATGRYFTAIPQLNESRPASVYGTSVVGRRQSTTTVNAIRLFPEQNWFLPDLTVKLYGWT